MDDCHAHINNATAPHTITLSAIATEQPHIRQDINTVAASPAEGCGTKQTWSVGMRNRGASRVARPQFGYVPDQNARTQTWAGQRSRVTN